MRNLHFYFLLYGLFIYIKHVMFYLCSSSHISWMDFKIKRTKLSDKVKRWYSKFSVLWFIQPLGESKGRLRTFENSQALEKFWILRVKTDRHLILLLICDITDTRHEALTIHLQCLSWSPRLVDWLLSICSSYRMRFSIYSYWTS